MLVVLEQLGTELPVWVDIGLNVVKFALAALLGMFLGLEREWSEKSAGIKTFALIALLGALVTIAESEILAFVGGLVIIAQSVLLAVRGMRSVHESSALSLTTSMSMLITYGIGILIGSREYLEAIVVAVLSSLFRYSNANYTSSHGDSRKGKSEAQRSSSLSRS